MKNEIRQEMKKKRKSLTKEEITDFSDKMCSFFLKSPLYKENKNIMIYYPCFNEADTFNIKEFCIYDNKNLIYPVCDEKTSIITPVLANRESEFKKGGFSVFEPCNEKEFEKEKIDVIIVPGLAFSKNGDRIGFGKGCYDRFLEGTKAKKIGFCYSFQLLDFKGDKNDVLMDFIITEEGIISCV